MKRLINFLTSGMIVLSALAVGAQNKTENKADDSRMTRDIEVAENVLSTLIKQEFSSRNFFPVEIRGSYRSGYGVTFTIPTEMFPVFWGNNEMVVVDAPGFYSFSTTVPDQLPVLEQELARKEHELAGKEKELAGKEKELAEKNKELKKTGKAPAPQARERSEEREAVAVAGYRSRGGTQVYQKQNRDSLINANNAKVILAAKNFLADYGDMLSQLGADEKVIITNKSDSRWVYYGQNEKRSILMVEAVKGDITSFRQGKITRDQLLAKIKVTNTESSGKREPDLEVLSSAFNRLYDSDLSTTFFVQGNTYYERLNDFGAILYMQVYSSNTLRDGVLSMPTQNLREVDEETRNKKVIELYPVFEKELKENILEYGSLVRSLKDNEQLVFNVKLTKCKGCGIPSDIEVSAPYSVLRDYSAGKIEKSSALSKISVKKGAGQ